MYEIFYPRWPFKIPFFLLLGRCQRRPLHRDAWKSREDLPRPRPRAIAQKAQSVVVGRAAQQRHVERQKTGLVPGKRLGKQQVAVPTVHSAIISVSVLLGAVSTGVIASVCGVRFPIRDCAATSARHKSAQSRTAKRIDLRFRAKNGHSGNGPLFAFCFILTKF